MPNQVHGPPLCYRYCRHDKSHHSNTLAHASRQMPAQLFSLNVYLLLPFEAAHAIRKPSFLPLKLAETHCDAFCGDIEVCS